MPPVVTAVRARGATWVEVFLDGRAWRTVPLDCAVDARLAIGAPLDRERARALNRSLRAHRGLHAAVRALAASDHTRASLDARLAGRGVARPEREQTLERLERAGLVDDARFAHQRAAALARRGHGDASIRCDLERRGVGEALVAEALAELEPEELRAERLLAEQGRTPRVARRLAARGFDAEVLGALIADGGEDGLR